MKLPLATLLSALILAALVLFSGASPGGLVKAKVPGQPVEISLEISGFAAKDDPGNPDRTIAFGAIGEDPPDPRSTSIFGAIGGDVWIWVSWRENFPAAASDALAKRFSSVKGLAAFSAQDTACFEFKMQSRGVLMQTLFEAYPVSPEYSFAIRVVVENLTADDLLSGKKNVAKFTRDAFSKIVKSFHGTGKADRAAMSLPPEAYAFRDEAAKSGPDPAGWTRKQCAARADDWAPQLYLGASARFEDKPELADVGFARAVELLDARKDRDAKLEFALAQAVGGGAWVQMRKKNCAAAIPLEQRVIEIAKPDAKTGLGDLGSNAAFDLACCFAQTQQAEKAIESLKQAIGAKPEWKSRAKGEELLKPIQKSKEFEALVGK
jgi:hypothetical protein